MSGDSGVQRLLEEILDSGLSPEEVCRDEPEFLPRVRERLRRVRRVEAQIDALLPPASPWGASSCPSATWRAVAAPPELPGYEVQEELGRGGMGVVYRAWDRRLNRPVALKMLLAGTHARPGERERFRREAEAEAGLRHPNIVQVYDVGVADERPYFIMEFVEGGSLAQKLAGVPLPAAQAAGLVAALAEAVQAAHDRGIVHRDLKPANVLLAADGTPKVTDFGLARRREDGPGLTHSGATLGTPSYMAPEQARGEKGAIGPATDVYSLGATLYECLTGRPPFRAETAAATLQQVMGDEPVPPARLNPQVPRDLDTICLKCLHKLPARRYAAAAALAEDLRRFQRGEPIAARPPGRGERSVRWTRRHPARATLAAAIALVALAAAGGGGWLVGHRIQTARAVEARLREVARLQVQSALPEARAYMEQARIRLGDDGSARLHALLDQARHDQRLLERLEAIRMTRSTYVEGRDNHLTDVRFNNAQADRGYQKAFRDAALGEPPDGPDGVAGRVKRSAVRVPLVAALDDWAVCALDGVRRDWVLRVATGADPDAWRDRARDPAAWRDGAALAELARTAPVAKQPPAMLLALGERLHLAGGDGVGLLRRVQEHYPDDFWTNLTLARAFHGAWRQGKGDWTAAAAYYQKALDIRPKAVTVHNNLGLVLMDVGWLDDNADGRRGPGAITLIRRALRIDPDFAPARNNLGLCLKRAGIWWVAVHEYQDALRADPDLAPAHFSLGEMDAGSGRIDKGIDYYREALRVDPDFARAHYYLGVALLAKGRRDEVDEDFPEGVESLSRFRGSALPEAIAYYWQAYECAPEWVVARNDLRIPAPDGARLDEAIDHYRQAIRLEPGWDRPHGGLGQALLAKRQFAEADAAIARCLELLLPKEAKLRVNLERLRERCRHLLALEGRLPGIVLGTDRPAANECLDAAELCFVKSHYATAALLYAEALAGASGLAEDLRAGHRFNAARAAALAGCGHGDDVAGRGETELKDLRNRAREWLRLDLTGWAEKVDTGQIGERIQARRGLSPWRDEPDLGGLRDAAALDRLSPAEREECRALWREVAAVLSRAETTR